MDRRKQHKSHAVARALHDIGLAAWFGGSLMGAIGLNAASREVRDPEDRLKVANAGWARWTPVNLAGIGAHLAGSIMLTRYNADRMRMQKGVKGLSIAKTAMTGAALGLTAYSRMLGERVMREGRAPVEGGVEPSTQTPEEVARAQRQLKALQWAVPGATAGLLALGSKMGEQQRPSQVLRGVAEMAKDVARENAEKARIKAMENAEKAREKGAEMMHDRKILARR